jgi:hypothetical protein
MLVTEGSGGSGLSLRYEDLDPVGPRTTFGNWLWTIVQPLVVAMRA